MLIEKSTIDINDIVTIKLVNSEEIIAKMVAQDENTVTVQKPMVMTLAMDERNRPAIQMMPFFTLGGKSDAKITLRREHMLVLTLSNDDAKSGYIHNTSGLAVPSSGSSGLIV